MGICSIDIPEIFKGRVSQESKLLCYSPSLFPTNCYKSPKESQYNKIVLQRSIIIMFSFVFLFQYYDIINEDNRKSLYIKDLELCRTHLQNDLIESKQCNNSLQIEIQQLKTDLESSLTNQSELIDRIKVTIISFKRIVLNLFIL